MNAPVPEPPVPATRQPVFNVPPVLTGLIALMLAIHAGRVFFLSDNTDLQVILDFAFIPIRETHPETYAELVSAGLGPRVQKILTSITVEQAKSLLPNHYTGFIASSHDYYAPIEKAGLAVGKIKPKT